MTTTWQHVCTVYFRWAGILALTIQVAILSYTITSTKFDVFGNHTLSDLGRSNVAGTYTVAFTLGGICLLFFVQYLRVLYQPAPGFVGVFVAGIMSLLVVGSVPDEINGRISTLHTVAALILIVSMALSPKLFSLNAAVPSHLRRTSRLFFHVYLLVLVPVVLLALTHHLLAFSELLCLAVFDVWVVYVSLADRQLN